LLAILATHPIQYQVPLWQALAKDGRIPFEVWYLSDHATRPSHDSQFDKTFAWDLDTLAGYPYRFIRTKPVHDVARFTKLRIEARFKDLLREKKVKALWVQGWQVAAYWQAVWQAHAERIPVWLRGESNDLAPTPPWKKPIRNMALDRLFKKISAFLYIGNANRRLYESFGITADRLHPALYGVDNARFMEQAETLRPQRNELRRQWGIPEDSFCVLFAGKFIPKKRPMDLIDAAACLNQSGSKRVHLLFAGSGQLESELRQACNVVCDINSPISSSANGHRPPASFTGFLNQTEISKAYVAADCLVLPSDHRETWGLVVNEALASGLPCAVSDACGCGEDLVAPSNPSLRFRLGEPLQIAEAITALMKSRLELSVTRSQVAQFSTASTLYTAVRLYR
jgi:glycosyltransferase involved in cell wall biosynthesis